MIQEKLLKKAIDKGFKCKSYETITIYDIMKWLREEQKLNICIWIDNDYTLDTNYIIYKTWLFWTYYIQSINTGSIVYNSPKFIYTNFQSWEETALDAVEYTLNNLI